MWHDSCGMSTLVLEFVKLPDSPLAGKIKDMTHLMVEIHGCNFSFATAVLKPTGVMGVIEYPLVEQGVRPGSIRKLNA